MGVFPTPSRSVARFSPDHRRRAGSPPHHPRPSAPVSRRRLALHVLDSGGLRVPPGQHSRDRSVLNYRDVEGGPFTGFFAADLMVSGRFNLRYYLVDGLFMFCTGQLHPVPLSAFHGTAPPTTAFSLRARGGSMWESAMAFRRPLLLSLSFSLLVVSTAGAEPLLGPAWATPTPSRPRPPSCSTAASTPRRPTTS